jgi:outer membrane protein OmpA-like peptidoglycan-associated protein
MKLILIALSLTLTLSCHFVWSQTDSLRVAEEELGNFFSKRAGARLFSATASDTSAGLFAERIIDENLGSRAVWRGKISKWKQPLDSCFVVIELPDFQTINSLAFNTNGCNESSFAGITAKSIKVEFSDDSLFSSPKKVVNDMLYINRERQIFTVAMQSVKWIRVWVLSNYGNKKFFELGRVYAYNDSEISQIQRQLSEDGKVDEPIEFKEKSALIQPESIPIIEHVAKILHENQDWQITIEGHTDNQGNTTDNKKLSENRAKSVLEELVKCGIDRKRLSSLGHGQSKPKCDNSTSEGRQCNRRVSFILKTDISSN